MNENLFYKWSGMDAGINERRFVLQVEWNEINAAWGQTVLLLSSLCRKLNLKFKRYELVPFGNYSYVKCLSDSVSKDKELPLYATGGYKFVGNTKFDAGMVAFLDCVQQLQEEMNVVSYD